MISTWFALALLALAGPTLSAQSFDVPDWDNSVRFQFVASQEPVRPGDSLEVAVLAQIDRGYHLYGPEERKPSRTEVAVSGDWVAAGEPLFPPVVTRDLSGLGTYDLYEGEIAIRIPISVDAGVPPGEPTPVDVRINYQVCTDVACSVPTHETLSLELPVASKGAAVEKRHEAIFGSKD